MALLTALFFATTLFLEGGSAVFLVGGLFFGVAVGAAAVVGFFRVVAVFFGVVVLVGAAESCWGDSYV